MPNPARRPALPASLALAPPTLAQLKIEPTAPTPLKGPSPLIHYTLENPYPLAILLVTIALIVFFVSNNRGNTKAARRGPLLPLLLAAAVLGSATAITTTREQVTAATKQLITDVAAGDATKVGQALTDTAKLFSPATPSGMDKDRLLTRISTMLGPNGPVRIQDHALLEAQVEPTPTNTVYVQVKVRVTPSGGGPIISWWRLDAVPAGKAWHFSGIKYIDSNFPIPDL